MFDARLERSSVFNDSRLVTMTLTYPRCIHAELMTHRMFSRNSASSRAIPIDKLIKQVNDTPFVPEVWGMNQAGMQGGEDYQDLDACRQAWLVAKRDAVANAIALRDLGLHKQVVNRVLEPFMWITVIVTGVDHAWENFFKLRCHELAEPHIQKLSYMARVVYDNSQSDILCEKGHLHLPFFGFDGDEAITKPEDKVALSVARCARVSYLTHDGKRDVEADLALYRRLLEAGHWSPFEHVAEPAWNGDGQSNLGPHWSQCRKWYLDEYCRRAPRDAD